MAIALCLWGDKGIRGTDQYWYMSDIQTVQEGKANLSNIFYPGKILRELRGQATPNYFIHNGPFIQIVGILGRHFDINNIWKALNISLHAFITLVILLVLKKYTNSQTGFITGSLYALSPIALWQSVNLLQEQFYAGLFAAMTLAFAHRNHSFGLYSLIPLFFIGSLTHPLFFILAMLFTGYRTLQSILNKSGKKMAGWAVLGLVLFTTKLQTSAIFPSTFQPDLKSIVSGSVPNVSNMLWHFSDLQPTITFELLVNKLESFFQQQFLQIFQMPFFLYTNLAFITFAVLAFTNRRSKYVEILLPIFLVFGLYVAMGVLMQNQPRYQQIISAASFITIGIFIYEFQKPYWKYFIFSLLCLNLVVGAYLMDRAHNQAISESAEIVAHKKSLSFISTNDNVVVYNYNDYIQLGYTLKPTKILAIKSQFLEPEDIAKTTALFNADYVITSRQIEKDILPYLNITSAPQRHGIFYVYESKN